MGQRHAGNTQLLQFSEWLKSERARTAGRWGGSGRSQRKREGNELPFRLDGRISHISIEQPRCFPVTIVPRLSLSLFLFLSARLFSRDSPPWRKDGKGVSEGGGRGNSGVTPFPYRRATY